MNQKMRRWYVYFFICSFITTLFIPVEKANASTIERTSGLKAIDSCWHYQNPPVDIRVKADGVNEAEPNNTMLKQLYWN